MHRGADERFVAVAVELVARVDVEALPVELRGDEPPRLERCYPRLDLHAAAGKVHDLARARADVGLGIERMELAEAADPPQHQLGLDEPREHAVARCLDLDGVLAALHPERGA